MKNESVFILEKALKNWYCYTRIWLLQLTSPSYSLETIVSFYFTPYPVSVLREHLIINLDFSESIILLYPPRWSLNTPIKALHNLGCGMQCTMQCPAQPHCGLRVIQYQLLSEQYHFFFHAVCYVKTYSV